MNAVSLYTMGFNFARIVGPSLGGVLILWIGVGGCYWVFAASLIFAAARTAVDSVKGRTSGQPGSRLPA